MNKFKAKRFSCLEHAVTAFMVAWCALPAIAGNKAMVSPNGFGKVEASISYNGVLSEVKNPATGVAGAATVFTPAAGVNAPSGFIGSIAVLPDGTPSSVYCTVTTERLTGGYKAVVRSFVTGGATADNDDVDLKMQVTPADCATYEVEATTVTNGPTSGQLLVTGTAGPGTAVWFRAFEFTGDPTNRDEVVKYGVLKYEVLVPGPFAYQGECPLNSPFTFGGSLSNLYVTTDAVAKSVPFVLTCPSDLVFECSLPANFAYGQPTVTGGCGTIQASYFPPVENLQFGLNLVTVTAWDSAGNTTNCVFTVKIEDTNAPVAPVLATVTGQCSATVTPPTATDNCAGTVTGTTSDPLTYTGQGTYTVHWTFSDGHGNSSTANQTVIVKDTIAPVPPVLATVSNQCSASVTAPTAIDNCVGTVTGTTGDSLTYTSQGTYIVHWTFSDGQGNSSAANQTVIVKDTIAPVAPVLATVSNQCSVTVAAPTATDNCVGTVTGTTSDPKTYTSQGTFIVHWTFSDGRGNSSAANQTVIVKDTIPPLIPSLPKVTGDCGSGVTLPVPTTTDNCGGSVTVTPNVPQVFTTPGTNRVLWTFTDAAGNSSAAYQTGIVASLTFKGFNYPIGTVSNTCSSVKCDSWWRKTLPIRFDMLCGTSKITSGQPPVIRIQKMKNCNPYGNPMVVTASYSSVYGWYYNWKTDDCDEDGIYKITATLPDGQAPYVFVKLQD